LLHRHRRTGLGLALAAAFVLSGCGFHPIYAPTESGMAAPAEVGFSRIVVGMNYGRYGQLLREDLQQKFDLGGEGVSKLYQLETNYRVNVDGIAFDYTLGFATRYRLIATADWSLISLDPDRHTITSGRARQVDGYNPIDNQPFYQDLQNDTTQSRLAKAVAQDISLQLASYFAQHPPPAN